jgi:hypothetical protein
MNYLTAGLTIGLIVCTGHFASAEALCGHDYTSIANFETTVKTAPNVKVLTSDASVVSYVDSENVIWNFSTKGSPAFPSVAYRKIVETDGKIKVETLLNCEASTDACNELAADYAKLDKKMTEDMAKQE